MQNPEISAFGWAFLFILAGILFVVMGLLTASFLRPNRPNEEKLSTYECGEDTVGSAWGQFNVRFYLIALIFVLFDVEIIFLFPWATVFGQEALIEASEGLWGWFALLEVLIFVGILILGLAYAWVKGYLDWVKPQNADIQYKSNIPEDAYAHLK